MRKCILTKEKLYSELRQKGHVTLSDVFAVVLEPPGKFAVFTQGKFAVFFVPHLPFFVPSPPPPAGQMLHHHLRHCLLAPEKLRSELRSKGRG